MQKAMVVLTSRLLKKHIAQTTEKPDLAQQVEDLKGFSVTIEKQLQNQEDQVEELQNDLEGWQQKYHQLEEAAQAVQKETAKFQIKSAE